MDTSIIVMFVCACLCVYILAMVDDADLEAELMALQGKSPGKKGKAPKGTMSLEDVDKMMAGLDDIGEDDDNDDDIDDDDEDMEELLGELKVVIVHVLYVWTLMDSNRTMMWTLIKQYTNMLFF